MQKIYLDRDITAFTKINSKYIINLNVDCKTLKLIYINIGGNLGDLEFHCDFLYTISKARSIKEKKKLTFWILLKLKKKKPALWDTIKRMKRQVTYWKKTFAKHILYRTSIQNIKEFLKPNNKKIIQFKNGQNT